MNKKVVIHGCLLGGLVIYTYLAWNGFEESQRKIDDVQWDPLDAAGNQAETASGMLKVAVPLLLTAIYGAILAIVYGLPALAGRVTEEMLGSTAEVDPDPLHDARAAVAAGEYTDAIAVYHEVLMEDPGRRTALLEIAKIQRTHLKSPALAASTLDEGLKGYGWEPDDRAFLMFRMIEIYEEDLEDRGKVIELLKEVTEKLEGTQHASNAAHRLKELEAG